jgi:hypothetical protein
MIQRKQTLYLLFLVFVGISFLFIPTQTMQVESVIYEIELVPIEAEGLKSTGSHLAATILNFIGIVLASATVFLYNKRSLQAKLCYTLSGIWIALGALIAFTPFAMSTDGSLETHKSFLALIISLFAIAAGLIAARFINKDINLLKSADRIR